MSSDRNLGPPGGRDDGEGGPSSPEKPATVEELTGSPTPQPHDKRAPRQCRPEAWMWRRRQAAQRMEPLNCPGRCRDPLFCRCHPPLSDRARRTRSSEHDVLLSERWIDAGADAARHILRIGLVPMLEPGRCAPCTSAAAVTASLHDGCGSWSHERRPRTRHRAACRAAVRRAAATSRSQTIPAITQIVDYAEAVRVTARKMDCHSTRRMTGPNTNSTPNAKPARSSPTWERDAASKTHTV